ncbi:alanine racemase, partial [Enterococcus hirae]
ADAEPGVDMLLGKPLPVQAARQFYSETGSAFDAERQLQWLIDSRPRLEQYLQLANDLDRRLNINLEIDVGLHRGGLTAPNQLDAMIA